MTGCQAAGGKQRGSQRVSSAPHLSAFKAFIADVFSPDGHCHRLLIGGLAEQAPPIETTLLAFMVNGFCLLLVVFVPSSFSPVSCPLSRFSALYHSVCVSTCRFLMIAAQQPGFE